MASLYTDAAPSLPFKFEEWRFDRSSLDEDYLKKEREEYGFNKLGDGQVRLAKSLSLACDILKWLLQDIHDYDMKFTCPDSVKLLGLIRYFFYSFISAFETDIRPKLERESIKYFADAYKTLKGSIGKVEVYLIKTRRERVLHFDNLTSMTLTELIARIIEARRGTVEHFRSQHDREDVHSEDSQATAYYFPHHPLYGRCWKCQCLYSYKMHPDAKKQEATDECLKLPDNPKDGTVYGGYPANSCAEDMAHTFCKALNASQSDGGWQKQKQKRRPTTTKAKQKEKQKEKAKAKNGFLGSLKFKLFGGGGHSKKPA